MYWAFAVHRLALWERECVEEQRREVVVERVGEPRATRMLGRKKCALKNSLAIAGATR